MGNAIVSLRHGIDPCGIVETMYRFIKYLSRRLRQDIHLISRTPKPFFDAKANENYWKIRKKDDKTGMNAYQRDRFEWIVGRIGDKHGTLLDVGSGNGEMLMAFRSAGLDCTGSDFSNISCERLRGNGFEVIHLDLNDESALADVPTYDYITICEVLEHLPNSESILLALLEKTNCGLYFSVPNTGYYPYRLRLLLGRFPIQWRAHPGEHVRFWTLTDMRWWLCQLGLMERSVIRTYQGWPLLGWIAPSLFAPAMIIEVRAAVVTRGP